MSEQQFFQDPAVDSLLEALLGLAAELHVTRTRQRALESLLSRSGVVADEALANWAPSPEEAEALELERRRGRRAPPTQAQLWEVYFAGGTVAHLSSPLSRSRPGFYLE